MTVDRTPSFHPFALAAALFISLAAVPARAHRGTPQSSSLQHREAVRKALANRNEHQRRLALVNEALRQRGARYVWGGASRGAFDCSGFTRYLFATKRGITLPHSASAQAQHGAPVPCSQLKPGDLLFFTTYRRGISHVGVYIGNHKFVHAANGRQGVRVDQLTGYYGRRLRAARRMP